MYGTLAKDFIPRKHKYTTDIEPTIQSPDGGNRDGSPFAIVCQAKTNKPTDAAMPKIGLKVTLFFAKNIPIKNNGRYCTTGNVT